MRLEEKTAINKPLTIKIKPNSLVLYYERPARGYIEEEKEVSKKSMNYCPPIKEKKDEFSPGQMSPAKRSNVSNGFISPRAAARLKVYIKLLFWKSGCMKIIKDKIEIQPRGKISFLTLSLSSIQFHDDQYIKSKMLNQFITELQKKYPGVLYIWRAEKQQNGNIHFHFLVNKFVPWQWARKVWNRIQDKEGYILPYTEKFKNMWFEQYIKQIKNFKIDRLPDYKRAYQKGCKCGWTDPNSIDVIDLKSAKSIYNYISKYISKNEQAPETMTNEQRFMLAVDGHTWFVCSGLSKLQMASDYVSSAVERELEIIRSISPDFFYQTPFFIVVKINIETCYSLGCREIYKMFCAALSPPEPSEIFTLNSEICNQSTNLKACGQSMSKTKSTNEISKLYLFPEMML